MFSAPNQLKYHKYHKIKLTNKHVEQNFFCPKFGDYGLQTLSYAKLTAEHLEAGRLVIKKLAKKQLFFKITVFPGSVLSKKSAGARMGKGKGKPSLWVCPTKKGRIIYEVASRRSRVVGLTAFQILKSAGKKLPIKTKITKLLY